MLIIALLLILGLIILYIVNASTNYINLSSNNSISGGKKKKKKARRKKKKKNRRKKKKGKKGKGSSGSSMPQQQLGLQLSTNKGIKIGKSIVNKFSGTVSFYYLIPNKSVSSFPIKLPLIILFSSDKQNDKNMCNPCNIIDNCYQPNEQLLFKSINSISLKDIDYYLFIPPSNNIINYNIINYNNIRFNNVDIRNFGKAIVNANIPHYDKDNPPFEIKFFNTINYICDSIESKNYDENTKECDGSQIYDQSEIFNMLNNYLFEFKEENVSHININKFFEYLFDKIFSPENMHLSSFMYDKMLKFMKVSSLDISTILKSFKKNYFTILENDNKLNNFKNINIHLYKSTKKIFINNPSSSVSEAAIKSIDELNSISVLIFINLINKTINSIFIELYTFFTIISSNSSLSFVYLNNNNSIINLVELLKMRNLYKLKKNIEKKDQNDLSYQCLDFSNIDIDLNKDLESIRNIVIPIDSYS